MNTTKRGGLLVLYIAASGRCYPVNYFKQTLGVNALPKAIAELRKKKINCSLFLHKKISVWDEKRSRCLFVGMIASFEILHDSGLYCLQLRSQLNVLHLKYSITQIELHGAI